MAYFSKKAQTSNAIEFSDPDALIEIPLRHCSNKQVDFGKSTFYSSTSTFIHIYFSGAVPVKSLDSIFLVTHSHFWIKFPKEAYRNISTSSACNFAGSSKKDKFISPFYKAFYSKDKRRIYIYMLAITDNRKYEVTWVVINDKYHTRIVDDISDL